MSDARFESDIRHPAAGEPDDPAPEPGFLPTAPPRANFESVAVRLIATAGVVGIGTAIGAVMSSSGAAGWIVALVASAVTVVLAGLLWRSRRL
jgi:hypothetical protein